MSRRPPPDKHICELVKLNALPIGITSQSIEDIKEMVNRLKINFDILSDYGLSFAKSLKLPTFSVGNKVFIKRLTLIVEFADRGDILDHADWGDVRLVP